MAPAAAESPLVITIGHSTHPPSFISADFPPPARPRLIE